MASQCAQPWHSRMWEQLHGMSSRAFGVEQFHGVSSHGSRMWEQLQGVSGCAIKVLEQLHGVSSHGSKVWGNALVCPAVPSRCEAAPWHVQPCRQGVGVAPWCVQLCLRGVEQLHSVSRCAVKVFEQLPGVSSHAMEMLKQLRCRSSWATKMLEQLHGVFRCAIEVLEQLPVCPAVPRGAMSSHEATGCAVPSQRSARSSCPVDSEKPKAP